MRATIITGGPGSGKTAVLPLLARRLAGRIAIVDGDNLSWVIPHQLSIEWLNLVQSNIAACAANFRDFGIDHFIAAYVLPSHERLARLAGLLRAEGFVVGAIALRASENLVRERLAERGHDPERNAELFRVAMDCCRALQQLDGVPYIDTDRLTIEQVADELHRTIELLTRT
jgi:broad-specificity NMP kinase